MHFKLFFIGLVSLGLWGCTKTITLTPPAFVREPVVAALLSPDSTLQVTLTYSYPTTGTDVTPTPIQNARVFIADNGQRLTPLAEQRPGVYRLNYHPQPGHVYALTAITPEGKTHTAQDRMPVAPVLSVTLTGPNAGNVNNNPDIILQTQPLPANEAVQWLSVYLRTEAFSTRQLTTTIEGIQSNSLLLDEFNSNLSGFNYKRSYWPYARITPVAADGLTNPTITFNTGNQVANLKKPGDRYQLTIWTGSPAFDRYLRSVITAYQNRISDGGGIGDNPFAQPSPVAGNISGGQGVFAAYVAQVVVLKEVN